MFRIFRIFHAKATMEYSIVLILLALLVANFGEIYAVEGKHSAYLNKNAGSVDCFDAYENCRKIPECKAALRVLNKKCKIAKGRCSADSELERCGEVADKLFMYGFEKKRCKCENKKKIQTCFRLLNKIYANPCFEEARDVIEHRKNNQTHPQDEITTKSTTQKNLIDVKPTAEPKSQGLASPEEDDGQKVEIETMQSQESIFESNPTSTIQTSKTTSKSHRPKQRKPQGAVAVSKREPIFGDEGFAKPPPGRRTLPRIHKAKSEKIAKSESSRKDEKISPVLEEVKMTTAVFDDWTTEATEESTASPARQHEYRIKLEDTSWEMTTDMKYRIIFIALGSVLVLAILATMLYLAWEKISKLPFPYKHGKIVIQNNGEVA